jgi:cytochrome c biogenesis protein
LNGTEAQPARPLRRQRSAGGVLLEFLGSMNLAITLLVAIAFASVIGTVLQQNEPYQDYIIKFGPFWFEVYRALGLYDVYSASWFLIILAFLVVSTSVCVYRHAPQMVRDMRRFRLNVQQKSLRAFRQRAEWEAPRPPAESLEIAGAFLQAHGYRVRRRDDAGHSVLAAMKGSTNRLGYIFTHVAIVVICVGALLDGNMRLKLAEVTGNLRVETRDIPASQVPPISRLPATNRSFRGNVTIPEGTAANVVFINLRDGYVVQELPFTVEVEEFRVRYHDTGQPKSFESDLVIHDDDLEEPLRRTIAVNHPWIYKGHAIYQATFGDGGSKLSLRAWPLTAGVPRESFEFDGAIFQNLPLDTHWGPITVELRDFQFFNINRVDDGEGERQFRNFGPSFTFRLRNAAGEALEYINYMLPVEQEGRSFYLSGMRESLAEEFRYLHIPAGPDASLQRFLRFQDMLYDTDRVRGVAERTAGDTLGEAGHADEGLVTSIAGTMVRLVALFGQGGFEALIADVEASVPEEQRTQALNAYVKVLQNILGALYVELLQEEGVDLSVGITEADAHFFDDAVNAMAALPTYAAPFFLELASFEQVEATGLQITKAPGKNVVYLGFILLMFGVFMMFYVAHRRVWIWAEPDNEGTRVLLAGTSNRDPRTFGEEFRQLEAGLTGSIGAHQVQDPQESK